VIKKCFNEEDFRNKCQEMCCYCLKEKPKYQSNCLYHSTCSDCENEKAINCKICKTFVFKRLKTTCCNCEKEFDLFNISSLDCTDTICKGCLKERESVECKLCSEERKVLSVSSLCNISRVNVSSMSLIMS